MFGFVYRKMGQAGKMTSTVLTFYPPPVRAMLRAPHLYALTPSLEISVGKQSKE